MSQFSLEPRAFPLCPASPQCPADQRTSCRGLYDHLAVQARDNVVATSHLLAVMDSRGTMDRARTELSARGDALVEASSEATSALRRLEIFLRQGHILAACRATTEIAARHADDGAHDRTRRLLPGRWTADILIILAAVFDTLFFGNLFRFLINVDTGTPWGRLAAVVAYIPGVVLAFSLLVSGLWLGEAVERWRIRRGGGPDADSAPRPEWLIPFGFLALVLTTVGAVAWVRPRFLQLFPGQNVEFVPEWVIILLLLMLTLTAIAAKVAARNSYVDSRETAEKQQSETNKNYAAILKEAEQGVLDHEQRWRDLRDSVFAVISEVEDLWAAVAWHRGHPDAGTVGPEHREDDSLQDAFAPLVRYMPVPPPGFGAVLGAVHSLDRYSCDPLRSELVRFSAEANQQWTTCAP